MTFDLILRTTTNALALAPKGVWPAFLVVLDPLGPAEMTALLALDGITGLVVTTESAAPLAGDARIGSMTADGDWTLPATKAQSLLVLKDRHLVGARCARTALRAGVTTLVGMDVCTIWHASSLWGRLLFKCVERVAGAAFQRFSVVPAVRDWRWSRQFDKLARRHIGVSADRFVPGRIVLINSSLVNGGAERQVVNTALNLDRAGYEVAILCSALGNGESSFYFHEIKDCIPVRRIRNLREEIAISIAPEALGVLQIFLNGSGLAGLSGLLPTWVIDDVVSCAAELLMERPSVVHLWQDYTNVTCGLAALLVGVPRIVLGMRSLAPCHFPYFLPFMAPIYRVLARQPHVAMLSNSLAGATDYATWLGIERERIQLLRNGIDEGMPPPASAEVGAWRQRIHLVPDAPVVGGVLRLTPEKNPLLWIETAAEVARIRPDAQFLLVGDGPMRDEVVHRAKALGISDRLHMPGVVQEMRWPMAAMDVLLLSSRVEGLPNVLIEAQMLGCPVVTTNAGGSAEAVDHGRTGWVVTAHQAQALAERVLYVLDHAEWRRQASAAAVAFSRAHFGMERMLAETLRVYGV